MRIYPYSTDFESAVVSLWERCGLIRPWNDPKKDIARKIAIDPDLLLVGLEGESLIGTIMVGYEGHRGWINYLAIDPDHRRKGYARQLMVAAENLLAERGCPKVICRLGRAIAQRSFFIEHLGTRSTMWSVSENVWRRINLLRLGASDLSPGLQPGFSPR
jgi:GNAT superfamily N-acetyltransferase